MAAKKRKKGNTGKRYDEAQKQAILAYVESQGRGGISKACKKFKVSYIALRRWLNGTSGNKVGRPAKAKALEGKKLKNVMDSLVALKTLKKELTQIQKTLKSLAN